MIDTWENEGGTVVLAAKKVSIFDLPGTRYNKTKGVYTKHEKVVAEKAVLTPGKIRAQENQHNISVRQRAYRNFSIPVVFGGLNTA